MFEYEGQRYEFRFNMRALRIVEDTIGRSILADMHQSQGMLPLGTLNAIFRNCLSRADGNGNIPNKQAEAICEAWMNDVGYSSVLTEIIESLQRDVPFLFRTQD